jgi:hypothetical protein
MVTFFVEQFETLFQMVKDRVITESEKQQILSTANTMIMQVNTILPAKYKLNAESIEKMSKPAADFLILFLIEVGVLKAEKGTVDA